MIQPRRGSPYAIAAVIAALVLGWAPFATSDDATDGSSAAHAPQSVAETCHATDHPAPRALVPELELSGPADDTELGDDPGAIGPSCIDRAAPCSWSSAVAGDERANGHARALLLDAPKTSPPASRSIC